MTELCLNTLQDKIWSVSNPNLFYCGYTNNICQHIWQHNGEISTNRLREIVRLSSPATTNDKARSS